MRLFEETVWVERSRTAASFPISHSTVDSAQPSFDKGLARPLSEMSPPQPYRTGQTCAYT